jgi:hypothetical protein
MGRGGPPKLMKTRLRSGAGLLACLPGGENGGSKKAGQEARPTRSVFDRAVVGGRLGKL